MQLEVNESITLKTWEENNAPLLFALVEANRECLFPWLPWVPGVKSVKDSVEFIQTSSSDPKSEKGLELGIWMQDQLVGCLGLHAVSKQSKFTSLGYWLGRDFQGKGIMTKSVAYLIEYCFKELDLNRIEIRAAVENAGSRGVAERLGFKQEGILRQVEYVANKYQNQVVYSLLREEFK
jgi:ribosomal-protein-serine acetyltransferase